MLTLSSPVRQIDTRIAGRRMGLREKGPPAFEVLASIDIETVDDLLHDYPRRYIDRSRVAKMGEAKLGEHVTVIGQVKRAFKRSTRRRQTMVTVTLYDRTGVIDLVFFNQPWAASLYREGAELAASGTVTSYRGRRQLVNFEIDVLRTEDADTVHTGRITPVHPATEGITARTIRELAFAALAKLTEIEDPLPPDIVAAERLGSFDRAIRAIHFPDSQKALALARERLKFDELFTLELGVAFRKHRIEGNEIGVAHSVEGELTSGLTSSLPFDLTDAQARVIAEVDERMIQPRPMHLLLQGDVGAGKTVVALHAVLAAIESGHQAAIMAPTEVLAAQHLRSVTALLGPLGARPFLDTLTRSIPTSAGQGSLLDPGAMADSNSGPEAPFTYALLTASVSGKERKWILEAARDGSVHLLIGTHALVQEGVELQDLSLAVIDEQHRFGVHQRMALKGKGVAPDVLIMTATPIPRTLALTYYGDLDVAVLDELPKGRQPIRTTVIRGEQPRAQAYDVVRGEARAGRQAFVVCAAIDEGNRADVKAAENEADRLANEIFPDLSVELLHGRMRPAEKQKRMEAFLTRELDVLISTTVIEVGVDVPNATVMLIENAERFGLAQLHQLRGRIGRGEHPSYCFLFDESAEDNAEARERLAAMARTTDGFALADDDLRLRGEGTLFDVKQSGMPDLKLARLAEDLELVRRARSRAFELIEADPRLESHPSLLAELEVRFASSIEWLFHA